MSKVILAIDPGPQESAWVHYDIEQTTIRACGIGPNDNIVHNLNYAGCAEFPCSAPVIEMIASYGMPVGKDVFETCVWIGRFIQGFPQYKRYKGQVFRLTRKDVKLHLCNSMRAKDSNIRQALIDRFGPGRDKAVGTKEKPGPLYGIKKDLWSALALAVTYADQLKIEKGD
jgi:hypothetical protein